MYRRFVLAVILVIGLFRVFDAQAQIDTPSPKNRSPNFANQVAVIQAAVKKSIALAEPSVVAIGRSKLSAEKKNNATDANSTSDSKDFAANEYGTGVVIESNGLILTNYHLLGEVSKSQYKVWNQGKSYFPTKVVAADPWSDLAILKVEATNLKPITMSVEKNIQKGMFVIALGNPHTIRKNGSPSASWGILANLSHRMKPRPNASGAVLHEHGQLLQTDALVKTSSSGGPLINLDGEMIGLVTSLESLSGFNSKTTYAIRIDEKIKRVISELKEGRIPEYGFLGVTPEDLPPEKNSQAGIRIAKTNIHRHTPAAKSGLELDDIITHVNNVPIYDAHDLYREVGLLTAGNVVQIKLRRTDPFLRRTKNIRRQAVLSKKANRSVREAISTAEPVSWRGITVDYPTASENFERMASQLDVAYGVLVTSVQEGSSAAMAGIQSGDILTEVNGSSVTNPAEFFRSVKPQTGSVTLKCTRQSTDVESIMVQKTIGEQR